MGLLEWSLLFELEKYSLLAHGDGDDIRHICDLDRLLNGGELDLRRRDLDLDRLCGGGERDLCIGDLDIDRLLYGGGEIGLKCAGDFDIDLCLLIILPIINKTTY